LVTWLKTALFRHFSTFSQSISPTILLQKVEKLTKNFSFLAQAPNPKQALTFGFWSIGGSMCLTGFRA
jgi:hypothetical protein